VSQLLVSQTLGVVKKHLEIHLIFLLINYNYKAINHYF
jgi:hypothetical protein